MRCTDLSQTATCSSDFLPRPGHFWSTAAVIQYRCWAVLLTFASLFVLILLPGLVFAEARQVNQFCFKKDVCQSLVVRKREVHFVDPTLNRDLVLGRYVSADQPLVPQSEAPIRELRSDLGWRIVLSAFLDHSEGRAKLRIRFFDPLGKLRGSSDAMMTLLDAKLGRLFGGTDEVLAFTSNEEHAYNVETEIWLLSEQGKPKLLVYVHGLLGEFVAASSEHKAGVWIDRDTYDGVNASTKGRARELWEWNGNEQTLVQKKQ